MRLKKLFRTCDLDTEYLEITLAFAMSIFSSKDRINYLENAGTYSPAEAIKKRSSNFHGVPVFIFQKNVLFRKIEEGIPCLSST